MHKVDNPEAAFVARVTASATHEIRNVLAIVKESAGLIDDMIQASRKRGVSPHEKMRQALGRIDAQVTRGAEIISHLNRFAHSLDHAESEIDLAEEARQVAFLCQRFARQKRQAVQVAPDTEPANLAANSLRVQMALHGVVECCLESLPDGSSVTMKTAPGNDGVSLMLLCETGGEPAEVDLDSSTAWDRMQWILDSLGATVDARSRDGRILLTLPVNSRA